jgi:hypothetical protein
MTKSLPVIHSQRSQIGILEKTLKISTQVTAKNIPKTARGQWPDLPRDILKKKMEKSSLGPLRLNPTQISSYSVRLVTEFGQLRPASLFSTPSRQGSPEIPSMRSQIQKIEKLSMRILSSTVNPTESHFSRVPMLMLVRIQSNASNHQNSPKRKLYYSPNQKCKTHSS